MSNQWGRNSSSVRTGGSSSGLLLPAVLCLLLVAGAVSFWFVRQSLQAEIAALGTEITTLNAEVVDITRRLGAVTAEKDQLASDLNAFRANAGDWAGELEKEYAELKLTEIPKLTRLLDKRDADIDELTKRLETLTSASEAAAKDYGQTLAAVSQSLATAKRNFDASVLRNQNLEQQVASREGDLAALRATHQKAVTERDQVARRLEAQRAETDAAIAALEERAKEAADARSDTLQAELNAQARTIDILQTRLAAAQAAPSTASGEDPAAAGPQPQRRSETSRDSEQRQPAQTAPRQRDAVEAAMRATPGLGGLDSDKTTRLTERLVSGVCVTEALEDVFDKVPLIVMRDLLRDLNSNC